MRINDKLWGMTDYEYNRYMRKYKADFKLRKDGDDIWYIKCKSGKIGLWDKSKDELFFITDAENAGVMKIGNLKRRIQSTAKNSMIFVDSYPNTFIVKFNEFDLFSYRELLGICKKRKVSEEAKQRFRESMAKLRAEGRI